MKPIRMFAATGMLGYGYADESIERALEMELDLIAADVHERFSQAKTLRLPTTAGTDITASLAGRAGRPVRPVRPSGRPTDTQHKPTDRRTD